MVRYRQPTSIKIHNTLQRALISLSLLSEGRLIFPLRHLHIASQARSRPKAAKALNQAMPCHTHLAVIPLPATAGNLFLSKSEGNLPAFLRSRILMPTAI